MFSLPDIQVSAQITETVRRQNSFQSNYMQFLTFHATFVFCQIPHFLRFKGVLEISLQLQNTRKVLSFLYMSY